MLTASRIEGRGPCTIHEVSVSETVKEESKGGLSSHTLDSLLAQEVRLKKALCRLQKCITAISRYSDSVNAQFLSPTAIVATQSGVEEFSAELDDKTLELEAQLEALTKEIETEKERLSKEKEDNQLDLKLLKKINVSVYADTNCEIELVLIYGQFILSLPK